LFNTFVEFDDVSPPDKSDALESCGTATANGNKADFGIIL